MAQGKGCGAANHEASCVIHLKSLTAAQTTRSAFSVPTFAFRGECQGTRSVSAAPGRPGAPID